MRLNILAHTAFIGETGYAHHARMFFTALNKYHNVKVRNYTVGKSWNSFTDREHDKEFYLTDEHRSMLILQTLYDQNGKRNDYSIYGYDNSFAPDIHIVLMDVNHHYFYDDYDGYKIAYTVWESTEYPKDFFKKLLEFDELWVPTEWQKEISVNQGYPKERIFVVPEGVDGEIFKPIKKPTKKDKFRFLLFGRWEYRKSTKEIIESFKKVFGDNNNVELLCSVENPYALDELKTTEERLKYYDIESPNIKSIGFVKRDEYVKYLQEGDVFISCARSEGYNLPLIEALACGTPSIYSNWGGQTDFADGFGIPINIIGEKPAKLGFLSGYNGNIPGNYCDPDFNHFEHVLLDVYNNYESYKKKILNKRDELITTFSWEEAAKKANHLLSKIKISKLSNKNFGLIQIDFEFEMLLSFLKDKEIYNVLEIGTDRGGTFYSWCLMFDGLKISVDLPNSSFSSPNVDVFRMNDKIKKRFNNVHFIHGDSVSVEVYDKVKEILKDEKIDFLFIDGDHSFEGVYSDFILYSELVRDNGWIAFHDIKDSTNHRQFGGFVSDFWEKLKGDKIEILGSTAKWMGIGVVQKNENLKL